MLLAVDIGNSSIKFGVFSKDDVTHCICRFSLASNVRRSCDEYVLLINQLLSFHSLADSINSSVIASVVPSITPIVCSAVASVTSTKPFIIGSGTKTGFKIRIDDPAEFGVDMVANAAAALAMTDAPVVIADFGTATTLSAINSNREMIGSVIIPGIKVSLDALSGSAELLNRASLSKPENLIGKNTADSIQSGVINGHIFMIDGFIRNLREQLCEKDQKLSLIATGGLSFTIIPYLRNKFTTVDDLTLIGIAQLYKNNRVK